MVFQLTDDLVFPHPDYAEEDGLLAVGGDLSINRLLLAYSNGIFPWPAEGYPMLWWSPNPRLILVPNEFKVSKSLKKTIRLETFDVKFDTDFEKVINKCAQVKRLGESGTWISNEIITAYVRLFDLGYAHSVSCYSEGELVGGLYGVSLGNAFFGESMFHTMTDASKVAMYYLIEFAKKNSFSYIDAQTSTKHLISLGAKEISRNEFLKLLKESNKKHTISEKWCLK